METDNLTEFINNRLALNIDENFDSVLKVQSLVEEVTYVDSVVTAVGQATRSLRRYKRNACISFGLHGNKSFGWCGKQWYIDNGYKIMNINDFLSEYADKIQKEEKIDPDQWLALIS